MYALYKASNDLLNSFFCSDGAYLVYIYGNIMVLFMECLPKEIRYYTGFALAYNIDFDVFGGLIAILMLFPC